MGAASSLALLANSRMGERIAEKVRKISVRERQVPAARAWTSNPTSAVVTMAVAIVMTACGVE